MSGASASASVVARNGAWQRLFAAALLDGRPLSPQTLLTWNGSDPAARFGVHRNNVMVSLVEALADSFEVTRQLVGAEFFRAMAREYVVACPPASPVLATYGGGFAAFVSQFAPANGVPYLADMARLEYRRVQAFHAADAPVIAPADLASWLERPERLAGSQAVFHPAASVIDFAHAVVDLWGAHGNGGSIDLAQVDPFRPQWALVTRHEADVLVIAIGERAASLFRGLMRGECLALAVADAQAGHGSFDLAASLALLIARGALSAWHSPLEDPPP